MRRISKTAAALTAGGALALGGIAVAAPVLAGGPGPGPGDRPAAYGRTFAPGGPPAGYGMGYGMGGGMGQMRGQPRGGGPGDGTCLGLPAPSGSVTAAQKATLARMAEEEKLAHDLYAAFAARYDPRILDQIGAAETRHLTAIRALLDRYGVPDPTAGKAAGQFTSAEVKATYDRLLAQGSGGEQAALKVGVTVEQAEVAALRKALQGLTAADVKQVYTHLLTTSQRHLEAFQSWAD
ncbi:MAG TPA: DUF2202 domain-containing protein [Streptosporangiaceae bacterium]